jgi:hypothetical protein
MSYNREIISLNIMGSSGDANTPNLPIHSGSSKTTFQFLYSGLISDATLSLKQSCDGSHFDPVLDVNGNAVSLTLVKTNASATLNLVNLLSQTLRFAIDFGANETGTIDNLIMITSD